MKHTYNEKEKEKIAQLVFNWLKEYDCHSGEKVYQNDDCNLWAADLVADLADIKDVTEE